MEVEHKITDIRAKMKKEIRAEEEKEVTEHLIAVYNKMVDWQKPTLNLQLGNGYTLVVGIVEDKGEK
jgi:negative regulator of sigma E activity